MKKLVFTSRQINLAKTLYAKRGSSLWVSKQMGLSPYGGWLLLNRIGIYSPDRALVNQKYKIKQDYFDNISTHEQSYILGLLWADGFNRQRVTGTDTNATTKISLHRRDKYLVEYIRNRIFPDGDKPVKSDKRGSYVLTITNKHISHILFLLGMKPNKTFESHLPKIKKNLMCSFLLGYFDGDGCISLQRRKTGKPAKLTNMSANVDIVSNHFIIGEIVKHFKKIGINFKTKLHKTPHYRHMYICSEKDVRAFYRYVYSHQKTFMTRKHNRFLEFFYYKKTRGYGKKIIQFKT